MSGGARSGGVGVSVDWALLDRQLERMRAAIRSSQRANRRWSVTCYLWFQREGRRDLAYPIGIRLRGTP